MSESAPPIALPAATHRRARLRLRTVREIVPAAIVAAFVLVALVGPLVVPYDSTATALPDRLRAPGAVLSDGSRAWLGTDAVGRDVLAQIVSGARVSLAVGAATIIFAGLIGSVIGLLTGYLGRWFDAVVMRFIDVQLAFPPILLAIIVSGVLGKSLLNLVIALGVTRWIVFARVARGSTLSLRERDFVSAARVLGVARRAILRRHVLPFLMGPLVAVATLEFGLVILAEAGLSFLGLGLPASTPSWGQTIANGKDYLSSAWWISAFPGIALTTVVIAIGLLGDQLSNRFGAARGAS